MVVLCCPDAGTQEKQTHECISNNMIYNNILEILRGAILLHYRRKGCEHFLYKFRSLLVNHFQYLSLLVN